MNALYVYQIAQMLLNTTPLVIVSPLYTARAAMNGLKYIKIHALYVKSII